MFKFAFTFNLLFVVVATSSFNNPIDFWSLGSCVEQANKHVGGVVPKTWGNSTAFTMGLFAGLGEFHPFLCATQMPGLPETMVATIMAEVGNIAYSCLHDPQGGACGDVVVVFAVGAMYMTEEILVGLPAECQASHEVVDELKQGVDFMKSLGFHEGFTTFALSSIEQIPRFNYSLDLLHSGHPFCAGYQSSVALQRVLEDLNTTSNTSNVMLKFVYGFVDGVALTPHVDNQCISWLRFESPSIVEDLTKMSPASLYNVFQIMSASLWECMPPGYASQAPSLQVEHVLASMKNPKHLRKAFLLNPLEISVEVAAMALSLKTGKWQRAGEKFGRIVGILANLHAPNYLAVV